MMSAFRLTIAYCLLVVAIVVAIERPAYSQPAKKPVAAARGKQSLEQSKRFKAGKDKTKVDFEESQIEGQAKNPFGTLLNSRDQDFNRGFIKLRFNWHDHMRMGAMGMGQ